MPIVSSPEPGIVLLRVKAIPGAKRDAVAGVLGDRLKVRVSAPPEGGRANKAIGSLLGKTLGVRATMVTVETGRSSPEKTLRIQGVSLQQVRESFGILHEPDGVP